MSSAERPFSPSRNGAPQIRVAATATAVPPHVLDHRNGREYLNRIFGLDGMRLEGMMAVLENSKIDQRYLIFPLEYTVQPRPLTQTTKEYQEHSILLGRRVVEECLRGASMRPRDIDMFITVSCTGVIIPSLDAHLMNLFGFRSDVRRLPITELGCAAGAAAMARAWEHIRAFPDHTVLVVSVELPSLTFQRQDVSQANLISSVLFGDGAAAAIVTGKPGGGPRILDAATYLFPNSLEAMGFDLRDGGFHIVLSRDVPDLIRSQIKELVDCYLKRHNLTRERVEAYVLHPGGQKLLSFVEEELGICNGKTQPSWDVLREYGNLSSASVLFVLHEWLTRRPVPAEAYGLLAAFGPGFSAEQLLLQWP
jgi:alkylresorcinol/alkylpyrone synthase